MEGCYEGNHFKSVTLDTDSKNCVQNLPLFHSQWKMLQFVITPRSVQGQID